MMGSNAKKPNHTSQTFAQEPMADDEYSKVQTQQTMSFAQRVTTILGNSNLCR